MPWHDTIADLQDALFDQFGGDDLFDYTPPGGALVTVRGIFRDPAELVESELDATLISIQPQVDVIQADLPGGAEPGVRDGSTWVRQSTGEVYEVASIEPDGEGILHLRLLAADPR